MDGLMDSRTPPRAQRQQKKRGKEASAVTLKEVARLAGVSTMTVSRAINQPSMVSEETLTSIRRSIDQLGYVPNLMAGGLRSNQSRLVAAIVPSIGTSMFAEAVEALTDRLSGAGYEVLLGLSGFDGSREDKLLLAVLSRKPDAIFVTGIDHSARTRQQLLAAGIPIVESWDLTPNPIDIAIGFSHEAAGRAAARHFFGKGYDRIAVVSASDKRALRRRDGFLRALAEHGKSDVAVRLTGTPGSLERGRAALADLLNAGVRPDAVFCTVDPLAQGAITEAQVRKLDVPGDIAVMGFGDFSFSAHMHPSLSTISFNRRKIGELAAELILAELGGTPSSDRVVDIGFSLVERQSTA
ncbi:transcriptional regulator (plasmid) [Azospirillum sp. B510]|uniref:LacI family DNA-binding transcriptional regulator n=1 Tax=Azospirillum sp. (strain B510) TaxID=137722 RepID=UPI0001C4C86A|nr:LacI family DNA-binding transcriptional regulator [Azospirillum sp. B510]BAI75644.1 transcriptional regulator [Azospirillum sp. B510]